MNGCLYNTERFLKNIFEEARILIKFKALRMKRTLFSKMFVRMFPSERMAAENIELVKAAKKKKKQVRSKVRICIKSIKCSH